MNKLFLFVFVLIFTVFTGCGDSDSKTDEDPINDNETADADTGETGDDADTGNTGDDVDDGNTGSCKIDDGIVDPVDGYSSYFSFNGVGVINDPASTARPEATLLSKMKLTLEGYDERTLASPYDFFTDDSDNPNGANTTLTVYGDPNTETQLYTTIVMTSISHDWITIFKDNDETAVPFSTMVQVVTLTPVTDDVSKVCNIAASTFAAYGEGEDATDLPEGKLEVCYDKNEAFAPGEMFRFGVNARLTTDVDELVEMFNDVDSPEDLCYCIDEDGQVECPEENPDDDADDDTDDVEEDVVPDDDVVDPCDPNPCDASEPICLADETEGFKCYQEHLEIAGEYTDNFDGTQIIGPAVWDQGATMGKFNISTWDNDNNVLIAQNDSGNGYNPEKWSRFDWTSDGTDVYFCQTVYDAATAQDAIDATPADSGDLLTGCNTFSWTKLIHIPMDILGEHVDNYSGTHTITFAKWDQGATLGSSSFKARYNSRKFAIAQNDSGYNPDKWSRFDWTVSEGKTYYCQTVYDAERFEDAYNATPADSGDLAAGCGGFSWSEFTDENLEIIGVYQDAYGEHIITQTIWDQGAAMGSFNIAAYFNAEGYLIAQNDSGNGFNPEKWSRFDWTMDGDDLYYCQTTYDSANIADAFSASPADAGNLASGCGSMNSPWTLLTPVVEESIDKASVDIAAWAGTNVSYTKGTEVTSYDDPSKALGVAEGTSTDIVCLGRGGSIVLGFTTPITNGAGPDFAVFENGLNDTFLELGYVEVSSDGTNFIRFDTYYLGTEPVDAFGGHDSDLIWGFAGKFMQGKGTQFDLEDLAGRAEVIDSTVNLNAITHVKIVDVIGDGSELDSLGNPIYDPYPTTGTAGFDLDAVAVINEVVD